MPKTFNTPSLSTIKNFASYQQYDEWLPGLYNETLYKNIFPIDFSGNLSEKTLFSEKSASSIDDFNISKNRFYLFLYCLKSRPYLFEKASKVISYDDDGYIFTPELAEYLQSIQTNKEKNKINSSLTIDLVKQYCLENNISVDAQKFSSFFDIANSEDYKNKVSRILGTILYQSVIKHTLYETLKNKNNFKFFKGSSAGWIDKTILFSSGDMTYFIDEEGGPDNKSFPAVCVLTKTTNVETKEEIIKKSNNYLSNIFGKNVTENCLANIIGEPSQFENNFKSIPIIKGSQSSKSFYNAVCIVYDFTKIIFSENKERNFFVQNVAEIGLGFLTKYIIELENINEIKKEPARFYEVIQNFDQNAFSEISYEFSNLDYHAKEIQNRINIESLEEIKNSIKQQFLLDSTQLAYSFQNYIDLLANSYDNARSNSAYLSEFGAQDNKIILHFDSFYNLLAATCVPKIDKEVAQTKEYSPFNVDKINQNFFDALYSDTKESTLTEKFYKNFLNFDKNLINFSEVKICFITKTFERLLYDNYQPNSRGYLYGDSNTIQKKSSLNLLDKILKITDINFLNNQILFSEKDGKFLDKNIQIVSLSTNYRETKYQSVSLQTMAFYLFYLNKNKTDSFMESIQDIKSFGELFHYPTLSIRPKVVTEEVGKEITKKTLEILEEIALISGEAQKAFEKFKSTIARSTRSAKSGGGTFEIDWTQELKDLGLGAVDVVNQTALSGIPCYGDLLLGIQTITRSEDWKEVVVNVVKLLLKTPIVEIIKTLLERLLNKIVYLGDSPPNACYDPPKKLSLDEQDFFQAYEYLLQIYFNSLNPFSPLTGFLNEIKKLATLDGWKALGLKLLKFVILLALQSLLEILIEFLKPEIEKFCNLDYEWIKNLANFGKEISPDDLEFSPAIPSDIYGNIAGAGGALYNVELSIDINVLIDLSQINTREYVYSKFIEEFSLENNKENYNQIASFLTNISYSVDLYEMATLLRRTQTEYTLTTILDSISLSDSPLKNIFIDETSIIKLFTFLAEYCDYRICYDILSRSLEKYVGNICAQPKKKEIETILKDFGANPADVIKDQLLDINKQIDRLCSNKLSIDIDLFTQGPKILANSLSRYLTMPFDTIVSFQQKTIEVKLGNGMSDQQKKKLQELGLDQFLFNPNSVDTYFNNEFKNNLGSVKISPTKGLSKPITVYSQNEKSNLLLYNLAQNTDQEFKNIVAAEKQKIKKFYAKYNIIIEDAQIEKNIIYKKFMNPLKAANNLYNILIKDIGKYETIYKDVYFSTDYLEDLQDELKQNIEEATNLDIKDTPESFSIYINKILQYNKLGGKKK